MAITLSVRPSSPTSWTFDDPMQALQVGAVQQKKGSNGSGPIQPLRAQEECWNALLETLDAQTPAELVALDPTELHFTMRPTARDVARVLEHYRAQGGRPEYHPLAQRAACAPRALGERIREEDMGEKQRVALVAAAYVSLARAVYDTLNERFGVQYW